MCSSFVSSVKCVPDLEVDHAVSDLGGSEDLYEKMFRLVLKLIPQNVGQMDDYLYAQDDLSAFAIKVHGTKGSLNQVGNKKLGKFAGMLEHAAKAGDKEYCLKHYGDFKNQLLLFCNQVEAVTSKDDDPKENENAPAENIRDFLDSFAKAKEAIEDFDSIAALDILSPLADRRFDGKADKLVAAAIESLEMFNLQKALEYIVQLQEEYGSG